MGGGADEEVVGEGEEDGRRTQIEFAGCLTLSGQETRTSPCSTFAKHDGVLHRATQTGTGWQDCGVPRRTVEIGTGRAENYGVSRRTTEISTGRENYSVPRTAI